MSYYVRGRRPPLGLSAGSTALVSTGANVVVPGSGPIVAVGLGVLDSLFGGARDKARQARETWFEQGARQGSVTSARVLIGGTQNTGSNERPMYEAGIQRLLADPRTASTMRAAQTLGPYWDSTDNETSDKMRAAVERELIELSTPVPGSTSFVPAAPSTAPLPSTSNGAPQFAPAVTAPSNWWPWALGAAGVLGAVLILPQIIGPSRRR